MRKLLTSSIFTLLLAGMIGCQNTESVKENNMEKTKISGKILGNGEFNKAIARSENKGNWFFSLNSGGSGRYKINDGVMEIKSLDTQVSPWAVQLIQGPVEIKKNAKYRLTFDAYSDEMRDITVKIGGKEPRGWAAYLQENVNLNTEMQQISLDFVMEEDTDKDARVEFWITSHLATVYMDNIKLEELGEGQKKVWNNKIILPESNALNNESWITEIDPNSNAKFNFDNESIAVKITDGGISKETVILTQGGFALEEEKEYSLSFDTKSNEEREIGIKIEDAETEVVYFEDQITINTENSKYNKIFMMKEKLSKNSQIKLLLGGVSNSEIEIENLYLSREVGQLVWAEEFDYEGLPNPENWSYDVGYIANQEYQYYTHADTDNAYVDGDKLIITAKKEKYEGMDYTSARIHSRNKADFLYGRVEFRAKLPGGSGTWPAAWMMPTDSAYGNWPKSGEIDVMEFVGNHPEYVHASTHAQDANFKIGNNPTSKYKVDNLTTDFHTFTIDWLPSRMDMYVDDILYFSLEKNEKNWKKWPYDQKFYPILNFAVGGTWGAASGFDPNIWPQTYEIDYVRVYDLNIDLSNDSEAPTSPKNLISERALPYLIPLSWDASKDNFGIKHYEIYMDGEKIAESASTNYTIANLEPETNYSFDIMAIDHAGNISDKVSLETTTSELNPVLLPARIKASDYLQMSGIQTEATKDSDGGENVGWIDAGDWLEYIIETQEAKEYTVNIRVAGVNAGGLIQLLDQNDNILTEITVPVTGDWQAWETITSNSFKLSEGIASLKLRAKSGGYNINWFEIK